VGKVKSNCVCENENGVPVECQPFCVSERVVHAIRPHYVEQVSGRRKVMRSILTILILLGTISTANADLRLTVNGEVIPDSYPEFAFIGMASETAAIGIHNDDPDQGGLVGFLHVTGVGILGFWEGQPTNVVNGPDGVIDMGTIDPQRWGVIQVDLAKPDPEFRIPTGIVADNIMFHIEGLGMGTIVLTDSPVPGSGTTLHTIYWTEVAEPMTLTILALGGLLLRRSR